MPARTCVANACLHNAWDALVGQLKAPEATSSEGAELVACGQGNVHKAQAQGERGLMGVRVWLERWREP